MAMFDPYLWRPPSCWAGANRWEIGFDETEHTFDTGTCKPAAQDFAGLRVGLFFISKPLASYWNC
jgi:hypothetical protein